MSLLAQAKLTEDHYIVLRVKAYAAQVIEGDPHVWTMQNIWTISAQPGWADAYDKSLSSEVVTDPAAWGGTAGADPSIITDEMIKAAVDAVRAKEITNDN